MAAARGPARQSCRPRARGSCPSFNPRSFFPFGRCLVKKEESMKWLLVLFLVLACLAFLSGGYHLHPENLQYYAKFQPGETKQVVTFTDGRTVTGAVVEETQDSVK